MESVFLPVLFTVVGCVGGIGLVLYLTRGASKPKDPFMARQRQVAGAVQNGGLGRSAPGNFSTGFPQSNFDYSQQIKGQSHRSNSLALGVIGLFFLGIILGPLAISQANKAESLGVPAAAGKVLGTIDLIGGALLLISFLVYSMG